MRKRNTKSFLQRENDLDAIWNNWTADGVLNDIGKDIKKVAKEKPKVKERLDHILRSLTSIRKFISNNDARNAVLATRFLDYLLYESGHFKPFYLIENAIRAGTESAKSREERFGWRDIQSRAQKIWNKNRRASFRQVAKRIWNQLSNEQYPDIPSTESIRKKIRKPTL